MFKNTYGFTFLVVLGAVFLTGPQSVSVVSEAASTPVVIHVSQAVGGAL